MLALGGVGGLSSSLNTLSEGAGLGCLIAWRHPQREQELGRSHIAFYERAQGVMQCPFPLWFKGRRKTDRNVGLEVLLGLFLENAICHRARPGAR